MPRAEVANWLSEIPESFSDPIRRIRAQTERELTGVLAMRHQLGLIDWGAVELIPVRTDSHIAAASAEIQQADIVLSEYPLFAAPGNETDRWGRMMPDLLFTDRDRTHLTLVEAKIDSHFTFSDDPPDGQVSRYLEYLAALSIPRKALIVVSPHFNVSWYSVRIKAALDALGSGLPAYVIDWQSIFSANRG